ncbi:MAG: CCA tRNA nucleotidyltransferase [Proteobacteria bacterium]|nr:CCA tRNA nucleotidyltransferase [Pseudomonadota bacterium]
MQRDEQRQGVDFILTALHQAGHQAWMVGGCVRDKLLNLTPKDYDLATTLLPEQGLELFRKLPQTTAYPSGIDHGTITVNYGKKVVSVEITTLRQDVKCDGRRAKVVFGDSLEKDARRRDFTINALYEDMHGRIYDFVDGRQDLENKILRFVGDPGQRIQEDALRILRFFRFAQRLGFSLDHYSLEAIKNHMMTISLLSRERVFAEIFSLFSDLSLTDAMNIESLRVDLKEQEDILAHRHHIWSQMMALKLFHYCGLDQLADKGHNSPTSGKDHLRDTEDGISNQCQKNLAIFLRFGASVPSHRWLISLPMSLFFSLFFKDKITQPEDMRRWLQLLRSSHSDQQACTLWLELFCLWSRILRDPDDPVILFDWIESAEKKRLFQPVAVKSKHSTEQTKATTWSHTQCVSVQQWLAQFLHLYGRGSYSREKIVISTIDHALNYLQVCEFALYMKVLFYDNLPAPYMSAKDIMAMTKLKPGKKLGEIMRELKVALWRGQIRNQEEAKLYLLALQGIGE